MIGGDSVEADPVAVGVDVGGTFTDAVVLSAGVLHVAKVATTPDDQAVGVLRAVDEALQAAGRTSAEVGWFTHGMTVGTNALLEGRGARAVLVTTEGFRDLLTLRRQDRAHLYRLSEAHAPPLVPPELTVGARERCGPDGVLMELTDNEIARVCEAVAGLSPESVAIGLLFSFAHPAHEMRLASALREHLPGVPVVASADLMPEIREYERISTTVVDAYLTPPVGAYLSSLGEGCDEIDLPRPDIMLSNGGVASIDDASEHAALTVLSGPAGGVIGASALVSDSEDGLVLTFDMGGTSTDVALIEGGRPGRAGGSRIAGHAVGLPVVDIETVSAGGGSIAWADDGGALRVGPQSAGARPGPAAYGLGGQAPTVTDANIVLGRIDSDAPLSDDVRLDPDAASAAVAALGDELGISMKACAQGIINVAVQEMVAALRRVSIERGVDPRQASLMAFGGAGPLHACDVADELGVSRIVLPPAAGLLAALGLAMAPVRRDLVQTVLLMADASASLVAARDELLQRAARLVPGGRTGIQGDCRYRGQSFHLTVPWDGDDPAELVRAFEANYGGHYGEPDPDATVEVVSLRAWIERPRTVPTVPEEAPVLPADGPGSHRLAGASLWLAPGWRLGHETGVGTLLSRES